METSTETGLDSIAKKLSVRLIVLFGSRARGHARGGSDYDVAYLAERSLSIAEQGNLAEAIAAVLGTNEDAIDAVDANEASPLLQFQIAKHGKLLYGSRRAMVQFTLLAWKRYQHTAKFRRLIDRALAQRYG